MQKAFNLQRRVQVSTGAFSITRLITTVSIEPNNTDWEKENRDTLVALVKFALNFTAYVKEMDPNLWKRAAEYAADYTKDHGISFTPSEEKEK